MTHRKPTAEQFVQRAYDLGVLTERQVQTIWSEFRRRDVPLDDVRAVALRKSLLTNYQFERIERGEKSGFFYGDYRTLYYVGAGSFARVYRAAHRKTGEIRAVKVLRTRFRDDAKTREQFLNEGKMGVSLRHDNIVPIYEVQDDSRNPFMVMEFVEGYSLREFVKIRKRLEPVEATRLIRDVTAGLAYAAGKGITHRDMKMSNVLVASTGTAKLVDFGLAAAAGKLSDEDLAGVTNPRTIDYAGLERCTGVKKDDLRSDIYFAGVIYYHMLSGVPPLQETKDRIQRLSVTRFQGVTPIIEYVPTLPRQVVQIVSRAMALDPDARYESPAAMVADVDSVLRKLESGEQLESGPAGSSGIGIGGGSGIGVGGSGIHSGDSRANSHSGGSGIHTGEGASGIHTGHGLSGIGSGIGSAIGSAIGMPARRTVMVIESNDQLQDALRKGLKKQGYRVLVISDVERALSRLVQDAELIPADCVVFSTNSLGAEAVDGFNRLGLARRTQRVPAILLVDKKHAADAEEAETEDHRICLNMPVAFSHFCEQVDRLMEMRSSV